MWVAFGIAGAFCFTIGLAIWLARNEGIKTERLLNQLAQKRKELEEAKRAKTITDNVNNLSDDDVSKRLQDISSK